MTIFLLFNWSILIPTVIQPALSQPHTTMEMSPNANITTTEFSVYNNPGLGIKILYPSDWKPFQTSTTVNRTIIEFRQKVMSEHDTLTSFMTVSVENLSGTIRTLDVLTKQNVDLANKTLPNFQLIESNITTLANNPAYKIISTFANSRPGDDPLHSPQFQTMTIWTIKGDRMYTISYSQITSEFSRYLPIIQKMIDSLEIAK
jgi:hypothetical protein